jgi:hypothetical protein
MVLPLCFFRSNMKCNGGKTSPGQQHEMPYPAFIAQCKEEMKQTPA